MTLALEPTALYGFLFALARCSAWVVLVPPFNSRMVPAQVKIGIAAGLALIVGGHMPSNEMPVETGAFVLALLAQVFTGLLLGFLTLMLFSAVQAAGSLIDLSGGFTISQAYDPFSNAQSSSFGRFYQLLAVTLLFAINGHLLLIKGFLTSFDALPMGVPNMASAQSLLTVGLGKMMIAAIEIAGPMLAALFLAELTLGMLTKASPQMNVFAISFPAKILLTLVLLGFLLPVLPEQVTSLINTAVKDGMHLSQAGN